MSDWMAIVLAGGVGSRLSPLTTYHPKPMLPVANQPMIKYVLELIIHAGIKKIIIAVRYLGDQIHKWVDSTNFKDVEIIIPDIDPEDTADAVRLCAPYIDRNFIVTMADIITNCDIKGLIAFHTFNDPLATICLKPVSDVSQFGITIINENNEVLLFIEKPSEIDVSEKVNKDVPIEKNLVNIGIYAFKYELLITLLENDHLQDFGKHVFPFLIDSKYDFKGYVTDDYWMDAGTVKKYIQVNNDVMNKLTPPLYPQLENKNNTKWIGKNVSIGKNTVIKEPVVLGNGCTIGSNCQIGPFATIGNDVDINNDVTIKNSVVMNNTKISDRVTIKSCVLASDVKIKSPISMEFMTIPEGENVTELKKQYQWG